MGTGVISEGHDTRLSRTRQSTGGTADRISADVSDILRNRQLSSDYVKNDYVKKALQKELSQLGVDIDI